MEKVYPKKMPPTTTRVMGVAAIPGGFIKPRSNDWFAPTFNVNGDAEFTIVGVGDIVFPDPSGGGAPSLELIVDGQGNEGSIIGISNLTQIVNNLWSATATIGAPVNPNFPNTLQAFDLFTKDPWPPTPTLGTVVPFYITNDANHNPPVKINAPQQAIQDPNDNTKKLIALNNGETDYFVQGSTVTVNVLTANAAETKVASTTVNVALHSNGIQGKWTASFPGLAPGYYTLTATNSALSTYGCTEFVDAT